MSIEKQIAIAHRLYECRQTAWKIFRDKTPETLEPWKASIRAEIATTGEDELLAALSLVEKAKGQEREGVRTMLIMAAAVEMIEQLKPTPMNNTPLLNEADPQEVAAALKEALRERDVAMEALRAERDAYVSALITIYNGKSSLHCTYENQLTATDMALVAKRVFDQYPPIKDNTNG